MKFDVTFRFDTAMKQEEVANHFHDLEMRLNEVSSSDGEELRLVNVVQAEDKVIDDNTLWGS